MIRITEAEHIVLNTSKDYGNETVPLEQSTGRVLAEPIEADRDLPPYDRVTMDGIAIQYELYELGKRSYRITGTQAAGAEPIAIDKETCIEIMTGAALPESADTIIRYEDVTIANGEATINTDAVKKGQNIHTRGKDVAAGQLLVPAHTKISPAVINTAASVGKASLLVKKHPKVVVISTGEELVAVDESPSPFEIRRSNNYAIAAVLKQEGITADMLHIKDDKTAITEIVAKCLTDYDVLILSGGVSMGKYDYLPQTLGELSVVKHFHKVKQRPGKPVWFGTNPEHKPVFAFPGNPVSAFMCMHRYFVPWLHKSSGISAKPLYAVLDEDYTFKPDLQYFLQVKLSSSKDGYIIATPFEGNGSGDFVNLLHTDAFMELPDTQQDFKKGSVYRVWPFKNIFS